jgi:type IX secretion system PorP/SprF family membrane protein
MKLRVRNIVSVIGFIFAMTSMQAQDIHFSQFYMSPLNLNPALTGVMNCNTRLVANYRNQWASVLQANAYNTYSVSYDQKIAVGRSDYFGIGGSFWGDVAGELDFGTTQGRLSLSYAKRMGGYRKSAHYLVIGADAALSQRRVRFGDDRWPSQHDGSGGFNPDLPTNEPAGIDNDFIYGDIAAGILWFSVLDESNNWYVGLASHHLNRPDVSFLSSLQDFDSVSLYSRFTIHGGGQFELKPKLSLLPGLIAMFQGPHRELNFGSSLRFALTESRLSSQYWQLGLWYRSGTQDEGGLHSDAVIFSTRFDYDNYGIGFSYDYNVSKLRQAGNANGAFEFSLNYLICGPEKRAVYCPRF